MIESERFVEVNPGRGIPEMSFLMPVYQQVQFVAAAIESVLAQVGIVAEIIVSDDASTDETFDLAEHTIRQWLARRDCPHRIVMRRGRVRLWRDHLPLLAEAATCDVVCQAHGDDVSHQLRGKIVLSVFEKYSKTVLVASKAEIIDAEGVKFGAEEQVSHHMQVRRLKMMEIIPGHPDVVGFSQAWRRKAVSVFPRLDRHRAAVAHDRILPFRAAIVGDVYVVDASLVLRRHHPMAAHKMMFHEPGTQGLFGWNLTRLVHLSSMNEDLEHALKSNLLNPERRDKLVQAIQFAMAKCSSYVVEAYREQMLNGRQIAWVDDAQMQQLKVAKITSNIQV